MDTVTIDEVEYVKASVLATQHHYTTDYIGQLCRARKVDAHLVGRTWYVYPPSLAGHKTTRYAELRSGEKLSEKSTISSLSRRDVIPALSKNTVRSQSPHFQDRVFWKNSKYEEDATGLLPQISKSESPALKMKLELADSERVRVVSSSKNVSMVSQPMPAVSLAGTLKVLNFEPRFDEVNDAGNQEFDDQKISHGVYEEELIEPSRFHETVLDDDPIDTDRADRRSAATGGSSEAAPRNVTYPVAIKKSSKESSVAFTHKSNPSNIDIENATRHRNSVNPHVPSDESRSERANSLFFRLVIAPAVLLLTIMVAGAMFVVESVVLVDSSGKEVSSWRFNSAAVSTIFGED